MKLKKAFVTMSGVALLVVSAWAARHHLPIHAATIGNAPPARRQGGRKWGSEQSKQEAGCILC